MNSPSRSRLDAWLPAALLIAGSVAFLGGGSQHPRVNVMTMPPAGSDEYFRHFAQMMLSMPNWHLIHTLLLMGPVLWALGAAGSTRVLPRRAGVLGDIGRTALLAGASLWALAFVLDGYVGPRYARAVMSAGVGADAGAIAAFGTNAFTMARIGMVSVVLIATSALALGAALLFDARTRSWRMLVGATGVLVGAWPLFATLQGEFSPGPFTSVYWTRTAISLGTWFLLLGTALPGLRLTEQPAHSHNPGDLTAG
jgi:hypothetical protein